MGMKERIEDAIRKFKKDAETYKKHRQRKYDGLPIGLLKEKGMKPVPPSHQFEKLQRNIRIQRQLNKPDVYGRPTKKYKI